MIIKLDLRNKIFGTQLSPITYIKEYRQGCVPNI